jgi:hypothetical protein
VLAEVLLLPLLLLVVVVVVALYAGWRCTICIFMLRAVTATVKFEA